MEPEEESVSTSQNQNLHDLQNYLVTFKNEIESSDDVLPNMDVDGGDVNDLYSGTGNHLPDPGDGEVSGQFSSGFYSEQGMLGTALSDEPTQQQIQNLVSSTEQEVDSEISSTKDVVSTIDLEGVQAQMDGFGDANLNQGIPDMQSGAAHQGIIMTSLGDSLDPNGGKMIQIVSLGGEDGQYLSLADGQQMQILNSEDLGLTESLEHIESSVDSNSSTTAAAIGTQNPQMALVSLSGNTAELPNSGGEMMAADCKDGTTGLIAASGAGGATLFNPGLASLVAVPSSIDGAQPQLFALHRPGITSESMPMANLLGAEGISQDLACQTITIVPSDLTQNGEMNFVLILSQPDGNKEGVASVAQICDLKQETTEITDTIVDENGETKNVLRLVPKKLVNDIGNQQLVCAYCNYTSPKRYLLTRHMKSHSEERPFKCEACSRGFKTAASLLNHVNTHTGTRPHKCKTCEAAFTTSGELVRHIRYRHTFEKPHSCPQCDYASVELSKLKRHMRSHTGERPYKCPSCPYASPDTYKLKRHMRIHTGEKPYECDICHARFTQSNSLKAHKLIHTGNKPIYQCSLCPTTCGRKTDLKIHFNKLHAVGSPLDCKKCGKEFSDRYSYKQHVRSHDLDKCFKCDQCDFMAATEKNLELHMSVHGRKYECDECHLSFILKHLLDKHKAMFHNNSGKDSSTEAKSKDEGDNGVVSELTRYDLSDIHSESEESSNLLSTPSASDTLHKNLMQDIKEGKLGDVPQVVIVHPDGSQEEISSKLTGDKWSIEELFTTATNNCQGRSEDLGKEITDSKQKETELSLTSGEDTSGSVPLSHSLLQTSEDEPHDLLVTEESQGQDSCFSHTEASQLCEASTQAEIESDTDSSGETPDHDIINGINATLSAPKPVIESDDSFQLGTKPGASNIKTLSSSTSIFNSLNRPEASSEEPSTSSMPNTYLKSLITHFKSSSSSLPLSSLSTPSRRITSVLQLPSSLSNSSNPTLKNNSGQQQYSLLKNLNFPSTSLTSIPGNNEPLNTGKDSIVKVLVNMGTTDSVDHSREATSIPLKILTSNLELGSSSPSVDDAKIVGTSLPNSNMAISTSNDSFGMESRKDGQGLFISMLDKDQSHLKLNAVSDSPTVYSNDTNTSSSVGTDTHGTNGNSQDILSLSCDKVLPVINSDTSAQVPLLTDFKHDEKSSDELEIFLPVVQKDNKSFILNSNSCDNDNKSVTSLSISESEKSEILDQANAMENLLQQRTESVTAISDSSQTVSRFELSLPNVDAMSKPVRDSSVPEVKSPPATKKNKSGKRHADMDQSLVMTGKRMRKALVKVSL